MSVLIYICHLPYILPVSMQCKVGLIYGHIYLDAFDDLEFPSQANTK